MARKKIVQPKAAAEGVYKALCDLQAGFEKEEAATVKQGEEVKLSAEDATALLAQGAIEAV
jgi:hypothetical protein